MFELATPEQVEQWAKDAERMTEEDYGEFCDNDVDAAGNLMDEPCGGKVVSIGGQGYYNGSYQCYTMYLRCENCGDYEVECV